MRLNDSNSGKKKPSPQSNKPLARPQSASQNDGKPSGQPPKSDNPRPGQGTPKSGSPAQGQRPPRPAQNRPQDASGRPQPRSGGSGGSGAPRRSNTGQTGPARSNSSEPRRRKSSSSRNSSGPTRKSNRPSRERSNSEQKPSRSKDFGDIVKHNGDMPKGTTNKPVKELTPEQKKKKAFRKKVVMAGIAAVVAFALIGGGMFAYKRFINPEIAATPASLSGAGSFKNWMDAVQNNNTDDLKVHVENSLLAQETAYAGKSDSRQKMVGSVLSNVSYEIPQTQQTTVYNKPVEKDGEPVMEEDDLMGTDPVVKLTYIDWDKVSTDPNTIKVFMDDAKVKPDDPDIREKLTDVFAEYISSLSANDNLPVKTVKWKPEFEEEKVADPSDPDSGKLINSRKISPKEDANLDKVLFSGKSMWRAETRFSAAALGTDPGADWSEWLGGLDTEGGEGSEAESKGESGSGTEEEGAGVGDPNAGGTITEDLEGDKDGQETPDGSEGITDSSDKTEEPAEEDGQDDVFPAEEEMPAVGNYSFISPYWIGAWFLQEGIVDEGKKFEKDVSPIFPPIGDGSKESPAGLNTSVLTVQLDKEKKGKKTKVVENPIRVELMQVSTGQDAFDFYQSKDSRNRGFTLESQVKYMSMRLKVTNLSKKEITIRDNTSLSDDQINLTDRTGQVFGLAGSVKLKPGESGVIESWAGSPTLDRSYLIWGADYNRKHDVVWFRTLAANEGKVDAVKDRDDSPGQSKEEEGSEEGTDDSTGIVEGNDGGVAPPEDEGGDDASSSEDKPDPGEPGVGAPPDESGLDD